MEEFNGTLELISGVKPANGRTFPLMRAIDVLMPDGRRLSEVSFSGSDTSDLCYFGYRYVDAERFTDGQGKVNPYIDISKGAGDTVKLYLFPTAEGYDAVVAGEGAIKDHAPYGVNTNGTLALKEDDRNYDVGKICRLHIEAGVTSIGDFFMCRAFNLKHLSFASSQNIKSIGNYAFSQTQISGAYDFSGLEQQTLLNSFECCPKLEGVTLNGAITEIGARAFQFCLNLRYVAGLQRVTKIGDAAFRYCACLEELDIVPENINLGNWAFHQTPNEAKVTATSTPLMTVNSWAGEGSLCFVQNEWTAEQLETINAVTANSMTLRIPEGDNQKADFYKGDWRAFWRGEDKAPATGHCGFFCLYHIYNYLHPNKQYDTYYDFITREIEPKKIVLSKDVSNDILASKMWELMKDNVGVSYTEGSAIPVTELPIALDYESTTYGEPGTAFWGICEVLGWHAKENLFGTYTNGVYTADTGKGAANKELILNELAQGRPVVMEIVFASEAPYDHGGHAVTAIGYNAESDKLLIIDSTWEFPFDVVPMVYELPFEALISQDAASAIWTFDFGEEITMPTLNEKLSAIMAFASFRIEKGVLTVENEDFRAPTTATETLNKQIPCIINGVSKQATAVSYGEADMFKLQIPVSANTKILIVQPDETTLSTINGIADAMSKTETTGGDVEVWWFTGLIGQCTSAVGKKDNTGMLLYKDIRPFIYNGATWYAWDDTANVTTCECSDAGFEAKITSMKKGSYNITAYCWDE